MAGPHPTSRSRHVRGQKALSQTEAHDMLMGHLSGSPRVSLPMLREPSRPKSPTRAPSTGRSRCDLTRRF